MEGTPSSSKQKIFNNLLSLPNLDNLEKEIRFDQWIGEPNPGKKRFEFRLHEKKH